MVDGGVDDDDEKSYANVCVSDWNILIRDQALARRINSQRDVIVNALPSLSSHLCAEPNCRLFVCLVVPVSSPGDIVSRCDRFD